jgi:glycosyltransferase involved in cell wall biosynthesis
MRALAKIQKRHAKCHALIIGGDDVSYGKPPKSARSWREHMLREVQIDPERTHFFGRVSRENYVRVLQVSAAHVYLTYPFVLSWSLLEAMACGAPIVASNTAPVREVIHGTKIGPLPGFFDTQGIADAVLKCLEEPKEARLQGAFGQSHVQGYSLKAGIQGYDRLVLSN